MPLTTITYRQSDVDQKVSEEPTPKRKSLPKFPLPIHDANEPISAVKWSYTDPLPTNQGSITVMRPNF